MFPPCPPQVFKAHITTSPSGKVADMFWLYDNRHELPENHRHAFTQLGASHTIMHMLMPMHACMAAFCAVAAPCRQACAAVHCGAMPMLMLMHRHFACLSCCRVLEVCDRVKGALGPDTGKLCSPDRPTGWVAPHMRSSPPACRRSCPAQLPVYRHACFA